MIERDQRGVLRLAWFAIGLLAIGGGAVGCATAPSQAQLAAADFGSPPADYSEQVHDHFMSSLKDPESMRDFYVTPPVKGSFQYNTYAERLFGYASLATVNAKNSFGGYVGKTLYVAFFVQGELVKVVKAEYTSSKTGYWGAFGQGRHLLILHDESEWEDAKAAIQER